MTTSQKYFLIVAEELNLTNAAKKLYVSQQSLSNHIKKLEEQYDCALFTRLPKLRLTPCGELLYNFLRQIQILEHNLDDGLREITAGTDSVFQIGMHTWRTQTIMPVVLPKFHQLYPSVKVKIYSKVATEMEQMLLDGKLDAIICRAHKLDNRIKSIRLFDEPMFLCVSDSLLQQYFPSDYPSCKERFKRGVNITEFRDMPFVLSLENSNAYADIMEYFSLHGVTPKCILQTNVSELHTGVLGLDYGAGFCPMSMIPLANHYVHMNSINIFPLNDYNINNPIQIGYLPSNYLPKYVNDFVNLVQDYFVDFSKQKIYIV